MSTTPPTLLSTNLINKPKTSAKKRTAPPNAASNTPTGLASDTSKKTGSLPRDTRSNLQSLLAQLEATRIATNSDGDSFSSSRVTSGVSSSDSRKSDSISSTREDDDVDMSEPPLKRARPQALNLSLTTTEARPERPPLQLFDPLSRDYQHTGLVDLPKVTIPSLERDDEIDLGEPPTMGRHSEKPNKMDAIFDFLLNSKR